MDNDNLELEDVSNALESWVIHKRNDWRDFFESNYAEDFEEYYRLWRAQFNSQDRMRKSERSKLISPALQQAVESSVAEVEEATFGRGKWFDIHDDVADEQKDDIQQIREQLQEDFATQKVRKDISEIILNAAVMGTGIGEIVVDTVKEYTPTQKPSGVGLNQYGVEISERVVVKLRPVLPHNFLIDPVATSVDESIGVIIDEFVPLHQVELLQEEGVYIAGPIEPAAPDYNLEPDKELAVFEDEKVRLTKYYGLVPTEMLQEHTDVEDPTAMYTESIVVIANNGQILKAIENPYMTKDRPVVAFPWDIVPGQFWGRGVCEKGYMSQKALDTEMRARIDSLALTIHPMMAIDASRMPPGSNPSVKPGKTILTNGNPAEVLQPFNFGQLDQSTFNQAQVLQQMVQQATGAVDSTGLLSSVSGEAKAGAVSMTLGAVIKRHKRTLINFQEAFLLPFVKKAACRYMQYCPELYPASDYKFIPSSTLGIIAREYEVSQLIQLLQTMSQDSPLYGALVQSIVDNMNLSNREELLQVLAQASQPTPEEQEAQQRAQQIQEALQMGQVEQIQAENQYITAQAKEADTRAMKNTVEAQLAPAKLEADMIRASMGDLQDDEESKDFKQRLEIVDRRLKQREIEVKEKAVETQRRNNADATRTSTTNQQSGPTPATPNGQTGQG